MQLSYNKLKSFTDCALKYRYAYVERLPRAPIRALAFHRKLHAALAQYHHFARRDGRVREDELLRAYGQIWETDRNPELKETKAYQEGEEILRRYCERENEAQRVPAYLEHPIRFSFGPYTLNGKVDRIDYSGENGYSIVDYKLDRELPRFNAAERSRQLSFYHLLVWESLGVEVEDARLYYLRHGVEQISVRSRQQIQETVAWIDEAAANIRQERRWEPREGEACRTCPFHAVCPTKTGQERPHAPVWNQADMWDLLGTAGETGAPEILKTTETSRTNATTQTTLDFD